MKTIIGFALIMALFFSSCESQNCEVPEKLNDGWETASLTDLNINKQLMDSLINDLNENKFPNTHSILIIKNNKLVFEKYLNGYDRTQKQYTASISKSAGSALIGIAMQEGLINKPGSGILDKPVHEIFEEYQNIIKQDSAKSHILYRHILSMTGGLQWDETTHPYNDSRNDWVAASQSNDPLLFLFKKPVETLPGEHFNYNGGYSIMLSKQIQDLTGKSAFEYAREKLFKPLEITDYEWESLQCGLTDTDGGLHLLPRDMAKLGQLYLNKGKWNGSQIISKEWVEESTKEQIKNDGMPNYGFQWWCGDFHYQNESSYTYLASGHGGQKIYVFPELNTVIVITHQVFNNNYGELNNILILSNYLLPAITRAQETTVKYEISEEDLKKYTGQYSNCQDSFNISLDENGLIANEENRPDLHLLPISRNNFIAFSPEGLTVHFKFSDQGKNLNIYMAFQELKYTKSK